MGTIVPAKFPSVLLEGADELEGADDEERADGDSGPGKPALEDGRLDHRDGYENRPHPREEVAEALADRDAEVDLVSV
jgi:hypothetical protein